MASQRWTEADVMAHTARMNKGKQETIGDVIDALNARHPKPSKYRNVRVVVDGEKFDSKREAQHWQELKLREKIGEIYELHRQYPYPLFCPELTASSESKPFVQVAIYKADFAFRDAKTHAIHVQDVKGGKATQTQVYKLKKKWLELQSGIVIEEI